LCFWFPSKEANFLGFVLAYEYIVYLNSWRDFMRYKFGLIVSHFFFCFDCLILLQLVRILIHNIWASLVFEQKTAMVLNKFIPVCIGLHFSDLYEDF
jgi:hypothetical protein